MGGKDFGFELRPDSQFVSKEGFREEIDQIRNNFQFVRSQTFNKRQCKIGLSIFIILSIFSHILFGILLLHLNRNQQFEQHKLESSVTGLTKDISKLRNLIVTRTNCEITKDYVNDFDKEVDYKCPDNMVLVRVVSYHENKPEDRRWKFECCTLVLVF